MRLTRGPISLCFWEMWDLKTVPLDWGVPYFPLLEVWVTCPDFLRVPPESDARSTARSADELLVPCVSMGQRRINCPQPRSGQPLKPRRFIVGTNLLFPFWESPTTFVTSTLKIPRADQFMNFLKYLASASMVLGTLVLLSSLK